MMGQAMSQRNHKTRKTRAALTITHSNAAAIYFNQLK
jgi:hypothetical protein